MNPFKLIASLNIGFLQKLELVALLADIKAVTRVDIYSGNENFKKVTDALLQAGLYICHMPVSDRPGHICGMAVSKKQALADAFFVANKKEDYSTIEKLNGTSICLPMVVPKKGAPEVKFLEILHDNAPSLYLEMILQRQLIAA